MKSKSKLTIAIATAVFAVLGGTAVHAQDKYSLKSPSGIAFSDFRGYEDWAVVSSARTDEVLKVIVANPTMIKAYKAGVPGNGGPGRHRVGPADIAALAIHLLTNTAVTGATFDIDGGQQLV